MIENKATECQKRSSEQNQLMTSLWKAHEMTEWETLNNKEVKF